MSKEKKIFVVMGTHGEYSDRSEWPVCAYEKEVLAQDHVRKSKEWVQKNSTIDGWYDNRPNNPFDPEESKCDYHYGSHPDTEWFVSHCPLRVSLPKARP